MPKGPGTPLDLRIVFGIYGALLLIPVLVTPFWIGEILQLFGTTKSFLIMLRWTMATPATAPLADIAQFPFVALFGPSTLAARLPSMLFAIGSGLLFWRLALRARLQRPFLTLLFFLLLPLHFQLASQGRPFEQSLFFLLLATLFYARLVEAPELLPALLYAGALVLCLYTEPFSYLPAIGYALFLLIFIAQADKRRALWYVLPATLVPVLLFAPYYFASQAKAVSPWLYGPEYYTFSVQRLWTFLRDLSARNWTGYPLSALLLLGAAIACWRAFKLSPTFMAKRVLLVCLLGGAIATIALSAAANNSNNSFASASRCLGAIPALLILTSASLDWLTQTVKLPLASSAIAILILGLSTFGDVLYVTSNPDNLKATSDLIGPELAGDSCLVFVSERLSRTLFVTFHPELVDRECINFFHKRIVLVIHSQVTPEQQEDARSVFRGLNYVETKQIRSNRDELIVMDQKK